MDSLIEKIGSNEYFQVAPNLDGYSVGKFWEFFD